MPIGKILTVDPISRMASVQVYGEDDDYIVRDARIEEASDLMRCTPRPGKTVRVVREGYDWYISGYPSVESPEARDQMEQEHTAPGDILLGNRSTGMVGVYRGGMMVLLANAVTGVMAIDRNDTVNILGANIYLDNAVYHKAIKTENGSAKITEQIAGTAGLRVISKSVDLLTGVCEYSSSGLQSVSIKLNNGTLDIKGPDITITSKTSAGGNVSLAVNGITGNVEISTPGTLKIDALRVGINSEAINPMEGVVTGQTICPFTKQPHIGCSRVVYAGKL